MNRLLQRIRPFVPRPVRKIYGAWFVARRALQLAFRLLQDARAGVNGSAIPMRHIFATIMAVWPDSLSTQLGLYGIYRAAQGLEREGIAGDFVECGVLRGASASMMGLAMRSSRVARRLWLFDSFEVPSLPLAQAALARPVKKSRWLPNERRYVPDEATVWRLIEKVRAPADRVHLFRGWFHETLPSAPLRRVALLNIDVGFYDPAKPCLEHFYKLLVPGAIVLLGGYRNDEYMQAVNDFLSEHSLSVTIEQDRGMIPYFRMPE